jgi:hypothetical protein
MRFKGVLRLWYWDKYRIDSFWPKYRAVVGVPYYITTNRNYLIEKFRF